MTEAVQPNVLAVRFFDGVGGVEKPRWMFPAGLSLSR